MHIGKKRGSLRFTHMAIAIIHRFIPSNSSPKHSNEKTNFHEKAMNSFGEDSKSKPDLAIIHHDVKTAESSVKHFDGTPDVAVFYGGAKKEEPNFDATPDIAVFLRWC